MTDNLFRVKNGIDIANTAITANSSVLNLNNAVISANGHVGDAGQVIFSDGTKNYYGFIVSAPPAPPGANSQIVFNDSGSSNAISNFSFNKTTNTITIGSATISPSTYTGSANNASYLGGIAAVNYQTTAGLSANVATLSANNASYLNGQPSSYYASSTSLSSYQTTAGLSANVATLSANNASYLNGQPSSYYSNASVINSCVRVDTTQSFSTGEKTQGRTNLGLASVAATGAYADLTGAPTLATVATSGNYSDLSGKPDPVLKTGNETIAGIKTFSSGPQWAADPTNANELTRKAYVDASGIARVGVDKIVGMRLTSDFTSTANAMVDVPGLSFEIGANEIWVVQGAIYTVVNRGQTFSFNGPASPAALHFGLNGSTQSQTSGGVQGQYYDSQLVIYAESLDLFSHIFGYFKNGPNAGSITFRFNGGSSTISTLFTNSICLVAMRLT